MTTEQKGGDGAAGTHGFDGKCAPSARESWSGQETFSLGIFEWVPKASGKGVKRGPVKVRVRGSVSSPRGAYRRAEAIASALNYKLYTGPKNVDATGDKP